jgi:Arc/MetJ family transcription regulator
MRTNIVIDDRLIGEAMAASGLKTKRAVVEEALRRMVALKQQEGLRKLRGAGWDGDLETMRRDA